MNETVADLAEELMARLPSDSDLIAARMYAGHFRGIPEDDECCVVARWLRSALRVPHVSVDLDSVSIMDERGNEYEVTVPPRLARFINEFDAFAFPYLIADGPTFEESWGKSHAS